MGLCVSKPKTYWTQHPDDASRMVQATEVVQTRAEKRAMQKEMNQAAKDLREMGLDVGKVKFKFEHFTY